MEACLLSMTVARLISTGNHFSTKSRTQPAKDPVLLNVIEHGARGDREAFLFGAPRLPKVAAPRLVSAVFPEAGYATLRSPTDDLTAIMKFGPHGGGHGHYDKLNFVLFSHGIMLADDPGTHFYGLPIHREWDSMTIAHNTISVDGQRQAQANRQAAGLEGRRWLDGRALGCGAPSTRRRVCSAPSC